MTTKKDEPVEVKIVQEPAKTDGAETKPAAPFEPGKAIDPTQGKVVEGEAQARSGEAPAPHAAADNSADLPVRLVTDPDTQADTVQAQETADHTVAGAATGPDPSGVVRDRFGHIADAPMGSLDAALNGVHVENSTGRVLSNNTDLRHEADKSGPANLAEFDARTAAAQASKIEK